jgi:predicted flap endonuclease-1-like 5' DNA nuclease
VASLLSIVAALLVGLLAGWLIWGRILVSRRPAAAETAPAATAVATPATPIVEDTSTSTDTEPASVAATETETVTHPEPAVVETEPAAKPDPITDPEPVTVAETEPVTPEPVTVVETEPVTVVETEPVVAEPEPVAVAENKTATKPESVTDLEPVTVAQTETVAHPEPEVIAAPAAETETVAHPEPVVTAAPAAEFEPALAAEPAKIAEPTAAAPAEVVTEPAPAVAETEPVAVVESEPVAEIEPEPVAATAVSPSPVGDKLTRIEGIGPKLAATLAAAGITTYAQLADADLAELRATIKAAKLRLSPNLATWPAQARLLAEGDQRGFTALADDLAADREPGVEPITPAEASAEAAAFTPAPAAEVAPEVQAPAVDPVPAQRTPGPIESAVPDDLTRIEGIGPKMAAALVAAGITTYAQLADTGEAGLRAAIAAAGMRFSPSLVTWPQQAKLLADRAVLQS